MGGPHRPRPTAGPGPKTFVPRLLAVLGVLLVLTVVGVTGYTTLEGWSFPDALYMTVITLTAVGYQEVRPLTEVGRSFTMILLLGGITWMGLWFALITAFFVELDLKNVFRRRRMMREIGKMSDHIIVCGVGRTGRQVVEELEGHGIPWVVIEQDPSRAEDLLAAIPDAYVIEADATQDQTLVEAGLESARGLVSCLSADTDNLFVTLSARDLNPDTTIVVRAYEKETMNKLYRAGASHVVSPNVSGAIRMASVLLRPSVVSFLDIATRSDDLDLRIEQASIPEGSRLAGQTLADAGIPQETGLIVIAVRKARGEEDNVVFNPVGDTLLEPGDEVIVLGKPEQVEGLRSYIQG
jgi:voltage-gated potassium channel